MNRKKDKFIIFLFGLIIIFLGWMVTTCKAGHVEVVSSISCRTDANGYTYCLNTKTGDKFIIKPTIEGIRT